MLSKWPAAIDAVWTFTPMTRLEFTCEVRAPLEPVWEFHVTPACLPLVTHPGITITLVDTPDIPCLGARFVMKIMRCGISVNWTGEYVQFDPPHGFVDRQLAGPFRFWEHSHGFEATTGGTLIRDELTYEPPFGVVGKLVDWVLLRRELRRMFAYRYERTREVLEGEGD
jgi:ligand-binding SRPBCC domain-containing protein